MIQKNTKINLSKHKHDKKKVETEAKKDLNTSILIIQFFALTKSIIFTNLQFSRNIF